MTERLTKAFIDAIKPDPARDLAFPDGTVAGPRLRVTKAGSKIMMFGYRAPDGRQRTISYPHATLDEARRLALAPIEFASNSLGVRGCANAGADNVPCRQSSFRSYMTAHVVYNSYLGLGDKSLTFLSIIEHRVVHAMVDLAGLTALGRNWPGQPHISDNDRIIARISQSTPKPSWTFGGRFRNSGERHDWSR